jgi:cell division protein FtsB
MRILTGKNGRVSWWRIGVLAALAAVILVPFCTGSRGLFTVIRLSRDVGQLRQDIVETAEENAAIEDTIEALDSGDPVALELEARKLGMIKPGETVYRVVPVDEDVEKK